jgi:hypothetical protein
MKRATVWGKGEIFGFTVGVTEILAPSSGPILRVDFEVLFDPAGAKYTGEKPVSGLKFNVQSLKFRKKN